MAKFNVTKAAPDGFLHHMAFNEVIDSLSWSLASLGHEVNVTQNWISEHGETNIVLGTELLSDFQRLPKNSIIYNLEQPSHPNMAIVRRMAKESGCVVWDYCRRAVEEWKALGFENVTHVPIGYTPNLCRIEHRLPDIDVLFLGWLTPRRVDILDALRKEGLKVYSSAACYGGGRDQLISRSKVCLNVHHDGRDRFEIVRCSYLMANGKLVVSEISSDDDEYEDLRNGISRAPYRLLVDTCVSYCLSSANQERLHMQEKAKELIQKRDFTSAVAAALESFSVSKPSVMSRRAERIAQKRDYLAEARAISRVERRYAQAIQEGDMKDFAMQLCHRAKGNVVEIGVRDGASTSAFLSGVKQNGGHVYSIDVEDCYHLFSGHPQWTFLHGDSKSPELRNLLPREIDVLLIDGDHTKTGVREDFNAYSPLVKPGGIVLFHDIAPEPNPGDIPDWPDDSVKNFYFSQCESLGWEHEELPGRYGMGILHKSVEVTV